jgi:hypothetical protein
LAETLKLRWQYKTRLVVHIADAPAHGKKYTPGTGGAAVQGHVADEVSMRMAREGAKVGDVTFTLTWDDRNDLDIYCITPAGNTISFSNKRQDGGYLDVDMNVGGESTEPVENIFFGDAEAVPPVEAARGMYKVSVQNHSYHEEPGSKTGEGKPIPFSMRLLQNGQTETRTGTVTGRGASSRVPVFEFEYGGRTAPPPSGKQLLQFRENYPDGDPDGRVPEDLLFQLMSQKNIDYYFLKINDHTDKMLGIFEEKVKGMGTRVFQVQNMGSDASVLQKVVAESIAASVAANGGGGAIGMEGRPAFGGHKSAPHAFDRTLEEDDEDDGDESGRE